MFEIVICVSIASRLNFDTRSSLWAKFDAESSISTEELMSLNMSSSLSSAENISMLNLKQIMMYMFSFLKFETSEASYFSEADVMKFLHWFYRLKKHHEMIDEKLIEMFLNYCEHEKHNHVRAQKNFVKKNWADLKCQFCAAFE